MSDSLTELLGLVKLAVSSGAVSSALLTAVLLTANFTNPSY